jgi:hypothetical protein
MADDKNKVRTKIKVPGRRKINANAKMTGKSGSGTATGNSARSGDTYSYKRDSKKTNRRGTKTVEKGTAVGKDKEGNTVPGTKVKYRTKTKTKK